MTNLINISDFTYGDGLNIGNDDQNFTYLYGLADFWQYVFQDTSLNNLILEASTLEASDIYNNFLQLCSGISLTNLATSASSQIRLEILSDTPQIGSYVGSGTISSVYSSSKWNPNITLSSVNVISQGSGFYIFSVPPNSLFAVGDILGISGVNDGSTYDVGNNIDISGIDSGGPNTNTMGAGWNSATFNVTAVSSDGSIITVYTSASLGSYSNGGYISSIIIPPNTYFLPEKVLSARFVANRPFLPTITLEEGVDYYINPTTSRITFAAPLASYGFPVRTAIGYEYSIWCVDARWDEQLLYSAYTQLIGRSLPNVGGTPYGDFLYGLYYMYTQGPSLEVLEKGLNLTLGIPLARETETVLDVREYQGSNNWVITTTDNSYVLTGGVFPCIVEGQTLKAGDLMGKYIELFDYQTNTYPMGVASAIKYGLTVVPTISGNTATFNWVNTPNYFQKGDILAFLNVPTSYGLNSSFDGNSYSNTFIVTAITSVSFDVTPYSPYNVPTTISPPTDPLLTDWQFGTIVIISGGHFKWWNEYSTGIPPNLLPFPPTTTPQGGSIYVANTRINSAPVGYSTAAVTSVGKVSTTVTVTMSTAIPTTFIAGENIMITGWPAYNGPQVILSTTTNSFSFTSSTAIPVGSPIWTTGSIIVGTSPLGAINSGYAGSWANQGWSDFIMYNYLRHNTFLVKVNAADSSILTNGFEDLTKTLSSLRPSHSYPVYTYTPMD